MTGEQSRKLKVGDRVTWTNSETDRGTVTAIDWSGVTIKWGAAPDVLIRHNDMASVTRV